MKIILLIILSVISAVLYRMGGKGKPYNTKYRDLGCPLCAILSLIILGYFHWTLILVFGLMFASMTTYWKKKGTDSKWRNWALTGLFYAISVLPIVIVHGIWVGFLYRIAFCTVLTVLWSQFINNDVQEELGRGAINNITLLFLIK